MGIKPQLITESLLIPLLPARHEDAHKGSFGSLAIIGGADSMVGAALLAGRSALYCGVGRTYVSLIATDSPAVDPCQPELMLRPVKSLDKLPLTAALIGPGLGQSKAALKLLREWIKRDVALLLDADALNMVAAFPSIAKSLRQRKAPTVITPHPAEAARILDCSPAEIQNNRFQSLLKLVERTGATCVLKGAGTLCADTQHGAFINTSGNVGLASGGTGDVLSGTVGAFLAQGLSGLNAAKLGVYLHGAAADALVSQGIGPAGLTASELIPAIRKRLNLLYLKTK